MAKICPKYLDVYHFIYNKRFLIGFFRFFYRIQMTKNFVLLISKEDLFTLESLLRKLDQFGLNILDLINFK